MNVTPGVARVISTVLLGVGTLTCFGAFADAQQVKQRPLSVEAGEGAISAEDRAKIEQALPAGAIVKPSKPRRLLIFDVNVGYPGHSSRFHANLAFQRMGEKTGAFQTVISRDPAVFEPESLQRFDAVFLNNTVGNLFEDPRLRQSLLEFVCGGGGLLGVHGTSVAFTHWPGAREDWPEFGVMLGARGASHRNNDEHVFFRFDDPDHRLNRPFGGKGFDFKDEYFRFHEPYSRDRVRVLLSIDTQKTDMNQGPPRGGVERADGDYAIAWVRSYGRGRVFYCTVAHNPYVFRDPTLLRFYLGAVQFALGDLPAPTIPSARLTPAVKAQEKLGWRLGMTAYSFHKYTLFEAIDKTNKLGLPYFGGLSFQKVSREIPKNFDGQLSDDELRQIRLKLDSAGIRLLTHYYARIPADEEGCRRVFEFGRKMGIETFISEPPLEALDTIERFCDEYDINLAIHNHGEKQSPHYWHPDKILEVCEGRSQRIGACVDVGYWVRSGIDPVEGVRKLGSRLVTIQIHDLHECSSEGHDVPWGSGDVGVEKLLKELHRLGVRPTMFGLEYSYDWYDSMPEIAESVEFFNKVSLQLESERARGALIQSITKQTLRRNRDGSAVTWFHPRACVIPAGNGQSTVLMTLQEIGGSDYFGPVHWSQSDDLGKTWSEPEPIAVLGRDPVEGHAGLLAGVCDVTPQFHPQTGTVLALGHVVFYRGPRFSRGDQLARYPVYAVRRRDGSWSERKILKWDDPRGGYIYTNNCGQRVVMPNGDIMMSFTFGAEATNRMVAGVRCSFDGEELKVLEVGPPLENKVGRGLLEPSLTKSRDRFYLTIRAEDGHGYVAVSDDGLNYRRKTAWAWDDGQPIAMSTTQQHWLTHSEGLFLVYTRKDASNTNVIRWRSPLWVARVDTERLCLVRSTEQTVLPLVGDGVKNPDEVALMGNFNVTNVSPHESWVTVGEWMPRRGAKGDLLLSRIRWSRPNSF